MQTPSLSRELKIAASVKGLTLEPVQLMVAPIDSLDPFLLERFQLASPLNYKQTFTYTQTEIKQGMYLVVGLKEYPIKGVSAYPELDGSGFFFYQLIIEDLATA